MNDLNPMTFLEFLSNTINVTYPISFIAMVLSLFAWGHRFLIFVRITKHNKDVIDSLMQEISRTR